MGEVVRVAEIRTFGERRFSASAWARDYRQEVARAFREVPLYREQWAEAGRELAEPLPVDASELVDQAVRLCPLGSPFDPRSEPSLWTGQPAELRGVLQLAGVLETAIPVLEIRAAIVDWTRLGRRGPRYRALLGADADATPACRAAFFAAAAAAAVAADSAVVVGSPPELARALPELRAAAGGRVMLEPVPCLSLAEASLARGTGGPALLHDRCLGFLGAHVPACGQFHVDWRRCYVSFDGRGPLVTRLGQRRPTLVSVRPDDGGFAAIRDCHQHRSPVLVA